MANQLKVHEQQTIVNLAKLGWGIRKISRELGISRNTVRTFIMEAEINDFARHYGTTILPCLPRKPEGPFEIFTF